MKKFVKTLCHLYLCVLSSVQSIVNHVVKEKKRKKKRHCVDNIFNSLIIVFPCTPKSENQNTFLWKKQKKHGWIISPSDFHMNTEEWKQEKPSLVATTFIASSWASLPTIVLICQFFLKNPKLGKFFNDWTIEQICPLEWCII